MLAVIILLGLLSCFFGYFIQKVIIIIEGILIGGAIGAGLGFLIAPTNIGIIIAFGVIMAILGGFLAYKIFMFAVFMRFWFIGTLFFGGASFVIGGSGSIGNLINSLTNIKIYAVIGLVAGLILAIIVVIVYKPMIICVTGIAGGVAAGYCISEALNFHIAFGIVFSIVLAVIGIIFQFKMNKKNEKNTLDAGVGEKTNRNTQSNYDDNNTQLLQKPMSTEPDMESKQIRSESVVANIVPKYYCPKSRLLINQIVLIKDSSDNISFSLDLYNIGDKGVIALFFKIIGKDIAGELLGEQDYSIIDINISQNTTFSTKPIELFHPLIRNVQIVLSKMVTEDSEVICFEESDTKLIPESKRIDQVFDNDIIELLELRGGDQYLFLPLEENLWKCSCGNIGNTVCSYCKNKREDSLSEDNIPVRLKEKIEENIDAANNSKSLKDICKYEDKIQKARNVLADKNGFEELVILCDEALESISQRKNKIETGKNNRKKKTKKILIFSGITAAAIALVIGIVIFIISRPPSDDKIKSIAAEYVNNLDGSFEVIDTEITNAANWQNTIDSMVKVKAKRKNSDDYSIFEMYINFYKYNLKYEHSFSGEVRETVYPDHTPNTNDVFTLPKVALDYSGYRKYDINNETEVNMEVSYDDIIIDGNEAEVPVQLAVKGINSKGKTKETIRYTYEGNCLWKCSSTVDVVMNQENELPEETIATNTRDRAVDYDGSDIQLDNEHTRLENYNVEYSDQYLLAEVYGDFKWENENVILSGKLTEEYSYDGNSWIFKKIVISEDDIDPEWTCDITDEQVLEQLPDIIENNCEENIRVNNIRIINSRKKGSKKIFEIQYYSTQGNVFSLLNEIEVKYQPTISNGYIFDGVELKGTSYNGIDHEINKNVTVKYSVDPDGARPINMDLEGEATVRLNIDTAGKVKISGKIGTVPIGYEGKIEYPSGDIKYTKGNNKTINVFWGTLWGNDMIDDYEFSMTPNIKYKNGKLKGDITFKRVGGSMKFKVSLK